MALPWLPFVGDVIIIMTFRIVTDLGAASKVTAACLNVCGKVAKLSLRLLISEIL